MTPSIYRRLAGFTMLPAIAAISPLLVLPVVSRAAPAEGWASALAGESVGTFAAIAIAYGWTTIGPALVAIAPDDHERGALYRQALVVRLLVACVALPILVLICTLVASDGYELLAALMGVQGALIALSFTWFAVGIGTPGSIAFYDSIPRVLMAALAAVVILQTGVIEFYPIAGIAVTVVGTTWYTVNVLRRYPGAWPRMRSVPSLFRVGAPVALNDAALGAYSAVPTPLVNVTSPGLAAAGFASGDKLAKLGQFLPLTLANALQTWTAEVYGAARERRLKLALSAHTVFGMIGALGLGLLGPFATLVLFGPSADAGFEIMIPLGVAFGFFSIRTSMTRHVLFPAGKSVTVMRATLLGTLVGVPAMVLLAIPFGAVGVATGYALTELIPTLVLIAPCRGAVQTLSAQEPRDV